MKNFQKSNKFKNIVQSKPVLFLLVILVLFFIWNMVSLFDKMQDTVKNRKIVEDKINELQKDKQKLSSDIASLNTDKGIEESIRNKFGLAKEGEDIIVVVEDKNLSEVKKGEEAKGFFSFLKNLFK
ncbi:MAG: septum formation initiator family protein [Candidatus Paceibacterota bacterium]|jgi:cell division protein FtsB